MMQKPYKSGVRGRFYLCDEVGHFLGLALLPELLAELEDVLLLVAEVGLVALGRRIVAALT